MMRTCVQLMMIIFGHWNVLTGHMYLFEGKDYSKETSAADQKAFDDLMAGESYRAHVMLPRGRLIQWILFSLVCFVSFSFILTLYIFDTE